MKLTSKQLKQIIKEEIESVIEGGPTMFPRPEPYRGGQSGGGVGVPGEFAAEEQKYVMAFSAILGISPQEAAAIPPEEISSMVQNITQAYQQKKMDAPPLNEPKGGWGDPFEDHPDNEQGSRRRRFESKTKQ
jgi:hypothetical protein